LEIHYPAVQTPKNDFSKSATINLLYYIVEYGKITGDDTLGLYNGIEIFIQKNIGYHI
jgi:hypothetical protein